MSTITTLGNLLHTIPLVRDASASGNLTVLKSLLGPAWRGMIQQVGKSTPTTQMPVEHGLAAPDLTVQDLIEDR